MARRRSRHERPEEFDIYEALDELDAQRPARRENRLVMVPSLMFMGRRQPEDLEDEGVGYRVPQDFVEWVFPQSAPIEVYPIVSDPVFGFTCGDYADLRYLELEAMATHRREIFYDELGFDEPGSRPATRAAVLAIFKKLRGPETQLVLRLNDETNFSDATPRYLKDQVGASERFLWSYAANFQRIALPLFGEALSEQRDLRPVARCLAGGKGRLLNALSLRDPDSMKTVHAAVSRPSYLAMLFALKATTQTQRNDVLGRLMDPVLVNRLSVGSRLEDGLLIGTRKFQSVSAGDAADDVVALLATGLLSADVDSATLTITKHGESFLEQIPPECDDPDWKAALFQEDGVIPWARSSRADEWVMTFFSSMRFGGE
jgi:hypothetical protein